MILLQNLRLFVTVLRRNECVLLRHRLEFSSTGHYRTLQGTRYILHGEDIYILFSRESVINNPQYDYGCVKICLLARERERERSYIVAASLENS